VRRAGGDRGAKEIVVIEIVQYLGWLGVSRRAAQVNE